MSAAAVNAARCAGLLLFLACGRQPPPGEGKEQGAMTASDSGLAGDTLTRQRPTVKAGAPSHGGEDPRSVPIPDKKRAAVVSVDELLDNTSLVGTVVSVWGRCLRRGAGQAQGAPPLTRSDWELGSGVRAVWVSGPRPAGCPAESGARDSSLVKGLAQADTLRMFDGTEQLRMYLLLEP